MYRMNYYNEHDPKAAAWLRELIRSGQIPPGDVDERSITEIKPHELSGYIQHHFFAGIGGWSLALQLAGWPATRPVWTGSCPCQPFSDAGKGLGEADPRHLWPTFFGLIRECRPPVVFGEQVASAAGLGWLDGVCADLEGAGYAVGAADLCAAGVGAPHIRQRLYWVAHPVCSRSLPATHAGIHRREKGTGARYGESLGRGDARAVADWQRVVFDHECDEDGNCPVCGTDFADCGCPGPTSEGWEHEERGGLLYARRMDDAVGEGLEGLAGHGDHGHEPGRIDALETGPAPEAGGAMSGKTGGTSGNTSWSRFDLIPCADGKTRRVESGTFPLVAGLPRGVVPSGDPRREGYAENTAEGRVMRLRGYGNSIVPQLAAEFIAAFTDIAP